MIQSMIQHLDGFAPLQLKILHYCLGTPSARAMEPIVEACSKTAHGSDHTAWRITEFPRRNVVTSASKSGVRSINEFAILLELRILKTPEGPSKTSDISALRSVAKTVFAIKYNGLTTKEVVGGTPTGIIMRNYLSNLFNRGLKIHCNGSLWGRFSGGQLLDYRRKPLGVSSIPLRIREEIMIALHSRHDLF